MLIMQREKFEYQGTRIKYEMGKNIFASSLTVHDIGCVLFIMVLLLFMLVLSFFPNQVLLNSAKKRVKNFYRISSLSSWKWGP